MACYSPHVQPGAPCDPLADQPCPSGQRCIGRVCSTSTLDDAQPLDDDASIVADAMPDGSPIIDSDGDGIVDANDNCPSNANPGQENEDGDKFGDVCDPCPPVADDNPADDDGDGVANACDPNPMTPGDSIALFEGFHHGVPATGWMVTGTWTAANDAISIDDTAAPAGPMLLHASRTTHETVSARVTITNLGGASGGRGVAVMDDAGPTSSVVCHITPSAGGHLTLIDPSVALFNAVAFAVATNTPVTLRERRDETAYICYGSDATQNQMVSGSSTTAAMPSAAGVRVRGMAATFEWIMLVAN